jgi:hypothetical protein
MHVVGVAGSKGLTGFKLRETQDQGAHRGIYTHTGTAHRHASPTRVNTGSKATGGAAQGAAASSNRTQSCSTATVGLPTTQQHTRRATWGADCNQGPHPPTKPQTPTPPRSRDQAHERRKGKVHHCGRCCDMGNARGCVRLGLGATGEVPMPTGPGHPPRARGWSAAGQTTQPIAYDADGRWGRGWGR